jgi:hypothetical protein
MAQAGRCVKITSNFTHPAAHTGNRVYPPSSYIYSYEADHVPTRREIEKHAKRKYAHENKIRQMWIGFIRTSDQMRFNLRADTSLKDNVPLVP